MGIRSLHKWLSWVCSTPPTVDWSTLSGSVVGIDALGFLYKAKQDGQTPQAAIADLIVLLKSHQIQPFFVFDGKSPADKQTTRTARKRQKDLLNETDREAACIQTHERNEVKQLLYASSCLSVNATQEADFVLAYMARQGWISAILSMDMDFLARGCETLLVPYKNTWQEYRLSAILAESKMSFSQFQTLCLLLGTDYNPSIPTLSYQRIHWSIANGGLDLETILKREGIRDNRLWLRARRILLGEEDTWASVLSEQQRIKCAAGIPPAEPEFWSGWPPETVAILCKPVQNYIFAVNNADETAADLRVVDTAEDPLTTSQKVPIVSMNNIRNNMAESRI